MTDDSDALRTLETLLAQKRRADAVLLDMECYDRWGAAHDTPENRAVMAERAQRAGRDRQDAVAALTALVTKLRVDRPDVVARWADLHAELLRRFIEHASGSTARFVANQERDAWAQVKRGDLPFVQENVYYVKIDRDAYVGLFGVEP